MKEINPENEFKRLFPFWGRLSEGQRESLCRAASYTKYEKGQNVHGSRGECTGVITVISGNLRVYMLSDEGREITLYRLFPGDVCMLTASCVIEAITFDVFADAEEESECLLINPGVFSALSQENVYVENFALGVAVERFSDVMWAMQQVLFMSFDKRLAVFLADYLAQSGGDTINLTQEQIAKHVGSAREVVSRMLKYFAAEKLVEVSRGGVKVLDKKRLREIIG